jgi:hypothetical protein
MVLRFTKMEENARLSPTVIPAKAGIQSSAIASGLDPRLRGDDG